MQRLTIGLITFNGEAHIRRSIESLLAQDFSDFELRIHDNASTDRTSAICAEFALKDNRVRHIRHPETISQSANFRSVLFAAHTELFMWATDDDIWHPLFARNCITELDRHPEAIAACTKVLFRRPDGSEYVARGTHSITGTQADRVRKYLANPRDSARLFGVYRTEALKRSYPADIAVFGYDWLVVCLSMLEGTHIEAPGTELVRSANAPGKYFERYDRHFTRTPGFVGRLSYFLPLAPLTEELRRYLPREIWRAARGRIIRLNLHQMLLLFRWKYPATEGLFRIARRIDRALGNG